MKQSKYHDARPLDSMRELIRGGATSFADHPAFLVKHERGGNYSEVTYREFAEQVDALGTRLHQMGFAGANIAVIGPNCYQWVVAYFAIVNGTGTVVPLDKELSPLEIANPRRVPP